MRAKFLRSLRRCPKQNLLKRYFTSQHSVKNSRVARVVRCKLGGTEEILDADKMAAAIRTSFETVPGFLKVQRKVCLADWNYEIAVLFENYDHLRAFMISDHKKSVDKLYKNLKMLAVDRLVVYQIFMYDEF